MNKALPEDALLQLKQHAAKGREAMKSGDRAAAEAAFLAAWACLPEPRTEYDHAQSLSRGLVAFYRDGGNVDRARHWYGVMRQAFGPQADPSSDFIGATVDFAAGDLDQAFRAFDALYKRFKARPFEGHDKKYLDFYKKRAAGA